MKDDPRLIAALGLVPQQPTREPTQQQPAPVAPDFSKMDTGAGYRTPVPLKQSPDQAAREHDQLLGRRIEQCKSDQFLHGRSPDGWR
jgi:hypothetical protein